jgi:hypothetical protein
MGLGYDPFVEWVGIDENVSENIGEGKAMPHGQKCTFS